MIPIEVDEVIAMGQHMLRARRRGERFWHVFWKGGSPEGTTQDERTPALMEMPDHPVRVVRSSVWGMSVPWTLAAATAIGIFQMAVPGIFEVSSGETTLVRIDVDFGDPPIFPPPVR